MGHRARSHPCYGCMRYYRCGCMAAVVWPQWCGRSGLAALQWPPWYGQHGMPIGVWAEWHARSMPAELWLWWYGGSCCDEGQRRAEGNMLWAGSHTRSI